MSQKGSDPFRDIRGGGGPPSGGLRTGPCGRDVPKGVRPDLGRGRVAGRVPGRSSYDGRARTRPSGIAMSVLRNLESKIAGLVEGTFGRVFKTEVSPSSWPASSPGDGRTQTVSLRRGPTCPTSTFIWLSPQGPQRYAGMEARWRPERSALPARARRREKYRSSSRPQIDGRRRAPRPRPGRVGIQARLVSPAATPGSSEQAAAPGARWSLPAVRSQEPLRRGRRAPPRPRVLPRGGQAPAVPAAGASSGAPATGVRRPGRHERLPAPRRRSGPRTGAGRWPTSARPTACASTAARPRARSR
jgi:hypothetical protein